MSAQVVWSPRARPFARLLAPALAAIRSATRGCEQVRVIRVVHPLETMAGFGEDHLVVAPISCLAPGLVVFGVQEEKGGSAGDLDPVWSPLVWDDQTGTDPFAALRACLPRAVRKCLGGRPLRLVGEPPPGLRSETPALPRGDWCTIRSCSGRAFEIDGTRRIGHSPDLAWALFGAADLVVAAPGPWLWDGIRCGVPIASWPDENDPGGVPAGCIVPAGMAVDAGWWSGFLGDKTRNGVPGRLAAVAGLGVFREQALAADNPMIRRRTLAARLWRKALTGLGFHPR